jgi:hypothetical protein
MGVLQSLEESAKIGQAKVLSGSRGAVNLETGELAALPALSDAHREGPVAKQA